MTFNEIKAKWEEVDNKALQDWHDRQGNMWKGPIGIEEALAFSNYRLGFLSGALMEILKTLSEQEKQSCAKS